MAASYGARSGSLSDEKEVGLGGKRQEMELLFVGKEIVLLRQSHG